MVGVMWYYVFFYLVMVVLFLLLSIMLMGIFVVFEWYVNCGMMCVMI